MFVLVYEAVCKLRAIRGLPISAGDLALLTAYGRHCLARSAAGRSARVSAP